MVTSTAITGDVATGTIAASFTVTIYSMMNTTTPNITSMSIMATDIGLLESRTVKANIITTTLVSFQAIRRRSVANIICTLCRWCISFRNVNVIYCRTTDIIEKKSILILKRPTNPNWGVFEYHIMIFYLARVFEIILGFHSIGISIIIKNILIQNITTSFIDKKSLCQVLEEEYTNWAQTLYAWEQ